MRTEQDVMERINELHKRLLDCKQRRLGYEARGDSYMVNLELTEEFSITGQIYALTWVLGVK